MKTSLILFATATAVPFFTLVGLSAIGAITTALSIVAMLGLDYDNSLSAAYEVKAAPVSVAKAAETNAFAA